MKKTVLILFLVLIQNVSLLAQDTLVAHSPKEAYFYNHWVEGDTIIPGPWLQLIDNYYEGAVAYHATDTTPIYGLAISLNFEDFAQTRPESLWIENSIDSTFCKVRLYTPSGNTMRMLGERRVYMQDPANYYLAQTRRDGGNMDSLVPTIPVYELYFDQPVTVIDTFYVGYNYSCSCSYNNETHERIYSARYNYMINGYAQMGRRKNPITWALHAFDDSWSIRTSLSLYPYYFIFAITTPPDTVVNPNDTTVNPNDTVVNPNDTTGVGIGERELLQRYVAVSPNPATSSATVTSSFGLSQVDLYDPQGRLLKTFPAASKASSSSTTPATLSLTLDLSALPHGTYLLRILTPLGPTTKKLLLQ